VGPRGRSGRARKISPPPGIDPLTSSPYLCITFLYGRETWSVALTEEYHLMVFENGVLRKTFRCKERGSKRRLEKIALWGAS